MAVPHGKDEAMRRLPFTFLVAVASAVALDACHSSTRAAAPNRQHAPATSTQSATTPVAPGSMRISLLGTNDLHGHIAALPLYAGYINNLRKLRATDGGAVVLVDGGDMFQGTLESNLVEGLSVVRAYAALGMNAVAVGNHEFDFGPVGAHAVPTGNEDPRGALKAAAAAAPYPFLLANMLENGKPPAWPNIVPHSTLDLRGVRIGFIGVTTHETLTTTLGANVADIRMQTLASAIRREALILRGEKHCDLVVVLAHAGGKCARFGGTAATDSCHDQSEAFKLARELGRGTVDAIVGGHTHAGVAHEVEGTPIIESFSHGKAFGRIDFDVSLTDRRVQSRRIHPPQSLCRETRDVDPTLCAPFPYENAEVVRDPKVAAIVAEDMARAAVRKSELLGTFLPNGLNGDYSTESAMGNAFCDMVLAATPGAEVAILNGGGLRADLPKGPLTYGALFEAFPFDNRMALIRTTWGSLRKVIRGHMHARGGIFSFAGVQVSAVCRDDKVDVDLRKPDGSTPDDTGSVTIVTSEYLAQGGDEFWGESGAQSGITIQDTLMRDVLEQQLRSKSQLDANAYLDRARPRIAFPAGKRRPLFCK
jgi:2',3'-cyclic-nucleotide 2'-phosphodiesterase (5'-nucleotidase family)